MSLEPNIYQQYTQITGLMLTGWTADKLDDMAEDYGERNVIHAIVQAKKYKAASNWNYITAILRNMKARGELIIERNGNDYATWND